MRRLGDGLCISAAFNSQSRCCKHCPPEQCHLLWPPQVCQPTGRGWLRCLFCQRFIRRDCQGVGLSASGEGRLLSLPPHLHCPDGAHHLGDRLPGQPECGVRQRGWQHPCVASRVCSTGRRCTRALHRHYQLPPGVPGAQHRHLVSAICYSQAVTTLRIIAAALLPQATPDGSAVLDLAAWAPSMLIYSTQQGGLAAWDLRAGRDAWSLPASPVAGVVERFVLDPAAHNWLLGGSSRGQLSLWDLRFRLPVNSWQHPAGAPITALAQASAPLHRLGLSAAAGPLVYVAAGEQEVGLWDIADAKCRQVHLCSNLVWVGHTRGQQRGGVLYSGIQLVSSLCPVLLSGFPAFHFVQVLRVLRPGNSETVRRQAPAALAPQAAGLLPSRGLDMMSRARQLAISELQTPQRRREGYRALLPTAGGQLLTAGSDRAVRCWDSGRPQQSYVVCAPPPPIPTAQVVGTAAAPDTAADASAGGAPLLAGGEGSQVSLVDVPQYTYASCSVHGVPVVEESCTLQRSSSGAAASGGDREQHLARVGWAERAAALCHQLAVTDLLRVEASEPLLLSAAADGVIKAWR